MLYGKGQAGSLVTSCNVVFTFLPRDATFQGVISGTGPKLICFSDHSLFKGAYLDKLSAVFLVSFMKIASVMAFKLSVKPFLPCMQPSVLGRHSHILWSIFLDIVLYFL